MPESPTISVIIPAFNSAGTIEQTIKSVIAQTFSDFELIVIDDGSIDNTVAVVESIADPRIRLYSYPNNGPAVARNRGLSHSKAELICFLDHDDLWHPDKLKQQYSALKDAPEAAWSYSGVTHFSGSPTIELVLDHAKFRFLSYAPSGNVFELTLQGNFHYYPCSNYMIKKSALTEIGGLNPAFGYSDDYGLVFSLSLKYSTVAVPSCHVFHRTSMNSASSNLSEMENSGLKVIETNFRLAGPRYQHLKEKALRAHYGYLVYRVTYPSKKQAFAYLRCQVKHFCYQRSKRLSSIYLLTKGVLKFLIVICLPAKWNQYHLANHSSRRE